MLARRVAIGVIVFLLVLELFTRFRLFQMSKDFRRFESYPARARTLVETAGPLRLAFIGNSATDRGVDARVVDATLAGAGHPARSDLFVADQSRVDTWRFILERYFAAPGLRPDMVVVTFYENDLEDGNPVEIGRLAQFFTGVRDWPEVFTVNLHDLDDRVSFVLSSGWATYAASERVRERLLGAIIPGFRTHTERINEIVYEHERRRARPSHEAPTGPQFVALGRMLDRAAQQGIKLAFVAYPTLVNGGGVPYELSPALVHLLETRGAPLLDLRRVSTLGPDLYADEVHLTEEGRRPYSQALGAALAPLLPASR
jgi:hypothetical protein